MSTGRNTATRDRDRNAIRRTKPPCGICEQDINYDLASPDPMSFEVDHILALANGGADTLDNKQASHRKCNRDKWHTLERNVHLICGPPGAGKTTMARSSGLTVFDLDDPHWNGSESLFRQAIGHLASDRAAQAAVIRSAATLSARQSAANMCGATSVTVVETDLETCIARITDRGRPPIREQIAAAQGWWNKYEPGSIGLPSTNGSTFAPHSFVTARSW